MRWGESGLNYSGDGFSDGTRLSLRSIGQGDDGEFVLRVTIESSLEPLPGTGVTHPPMAPLGSKIPTESIRI
jgi:hypothetical protein